MLSYQESGWVSWLILGGIKRIHQGLWPTSPGESGSRLDEGSYRSFAEIVKSGNDGFSLSQAQRSPMVDWEGRFKLLESSFTDLEGRVKYLESESSFNSPLFSRRYQVCLLFSSPFSRSLSTHGNGG